MSKRFFLFLAIIATLFLLAACGSGSLDETTVKGEVISVETKVDLEKRGIRVSYSSLYVSIQDEDNKVHKIYIWTFSLKKDEKIIPGSVIKVRYDNSRRTTEGRKEIYDEDGLYLRTEIVEEWNHVYALVVLKTPTTPIDAKMSIRNMPVGTYGYMIPMHIKNRDDGVCIRSFALVRPSINTTFSRGDSLIEYWNILARVERQPDGFHVSFVSSDALGLKDEAPRAILPLCN